jgi:hypothetical protein
MSSFEPQGRRPAVPRVKRGRGVGVVVLVLAASIPSSSLVQAQQAVPGFALERLYTSAPGAGWFVMDDLNLDGGLGGAVALTSGYARQPLKVTSPDGTQPLSVVSGQAFVDVGIAATYHRYRIYLNFPMPLLITGTSGVLGPYQFTAPDVNLGTNPDTISDARIGFDVRLLGEPGSLLRVGTGAQLIIPFGTRADYMTDSSFRGFVRGLVAGDRGRFSYAGQLGVHIRPLDDSPVPGSPAGSELVFGLSAGRRMSAGSGGTIVIGPEFFGETAFHSPAGGSTGFEGLLAVRFEGTGDGPHVRMKLGAGAGLDRQFGTPEWRVVGAVELLGARRGPAAAASRSGGSRF